MELVEGVDGGLRFLAGHGIFGVFRVCSAGIRDARVATQPVFGLRGISRGWGRGWGGV